LRFHVLDGPIGRIQADGSAGHVPEEKIPSTQDFPTSPRYPIRL